MRRKIISLLAALLLSVPFVTAHETDTEVMYLSGHGCDDPVQWDFYCSAGQHSGKWSKIAVPSCWELQGFGNYSYGRWYLQKDAQPCTETGHYKTSFRIPKDWNGRDVRLVFEGVMTDTRVLVNGQQVGAEHQGGFVRFSYDVTPYIKPGNNRLEVFVAKHSANESVNEAERKADWWIFGGIYRPVYLESKPASHIERFAVDAKADGYLRAEVYTKDAPAGASLRIEVSEAPNLMNRGKCSEEVLASKTFGLGNSYTLNVPNVQSWDPEHPHLYYIDVTLLNAEGKELHTMRERIGFRTLEFRRHDGIYLNGTRLVVKGTNRHCFYPDYGRTLSKRLSLEDAEVIQSMNMNAVRCHYPSDTHFLDVCDSLGLLYLEELPGWQTCYDDTTAAKMLPEVVTRDVNHPCVFIWSNGNEGGWNNTINQHFADFDPQHRHVMHPWGDFDGIDAHHYPPYQMGVDRFDKGQNIFMPTEFLHGLYDRGQGAGLEDYWNRWTQSPLFAGGFLWCFVDEAVRRTDKGNILDTDGRNAPDGIVGAYREPEGSYYTVKEIWSPIQIEPLKVREGLQEFRFLVRNAYLFTDLKDCSLRYDVQKCGMSVLANDTLAQGKIALPSTLPGESRYVSFMIPDNFYQGDVLEVIATDPFGKDICTWSAPIHRAEEANLPLTKSGKPQVRKEGDLIVLSSEDAEARFSSTTGLLLSLTKAGKTTKITNGPRPIGFNAALKGVDIRTNDSTAVLTCHYKGGLDSIVWTLNAAGALRMNALMLTRDKNGWEGSYVRQDQKGLLGLTFDYDESDCSGMEWIGRGPYRVWKNRLRGQQFGHFHKDYNNTITGVYDGTASVVYPEFKGYHAEMRWAKLESRNGAPLEMTSLTDNLYLRLFTPEEPKTLTKERMAEPFPEGDLSFLLEIPAIRSYKVLADQGPNSQPGEIRVHNGDDGLRINVVF